LQNEIWEEEQRLQFPHIHYLDMSKKLYDVKMSILEKVKENDN
jgi:nicotinate phosphoribosyltransferase